MNAVDGEGLMHEIAAVTGNDQARARKPADTAQVVDLCCGMGGLSVAAREMGMRVVAGVDVNHSALRTFSKNFPEAEALEGGVQSRTVLERCRTLLDGGGDGQCVRIVLSGPPCQGFSAAGSRDPKDRRNKVLVTVARAIARIQPDCALIENVSTVLAEKHGDWLESFRQALDRGNYHVERIVLDSSHFGVPQKRKRAFFFVTRQALNLERIHDLLERYKVPPIATREALHGLPPPAVRPDTYDDEAPVDGPANHFAMRHSRRVMEKIAAIPPGTGPMSYRRLHPVRPGPTRSFRATGHRPLIAALPATP